MNKPSKLPILLSLSALCIAGAVYVRNQIQTDLHHDLAWSRYGAPANLRAQADRWFPLTYPTLLGWTGDNDRLRSNYALETLLKKGQPFSYWWLVEQLKKNPRDYGFYGNDPDWQKKVGIDNPTKKAETIQLALAHIDERDSYEQSNIQFLTALTAESWPAVAAALPKASPKQAQALLAVFPYNLEGVPPDIVAQVKPFQAKLAAAEQEEDYSGSEKIANAPNAEAALKIYNQLSSKSRVYALESITYSEEYPLNMQPLVIHVFEDANDPLQVLAAAVLWTKKDVRGEAILDKALNGDFTALAVIKNRLMLLQLAQTFPDSRFTQACRAYGQIRGGTYFGGYRLNSESDIKLAKEPKAARQEELQWRTWLATYPKHPGADDASYWLGRSLMWQGKRSEALKQFADTMATPPPDGDMTYQFKQQFLWLLDVGTTTEELALFSRQYPTHPLAPAVQYAQAVRFARTHRYAEALKLTQTLDITAVTKILQHPYIEVDTNQLFARQQTRWTKLAQTTDPLAQIASWSSKRSYLNGYLVLYGGGRLGGTGTDDDLLPTLKDTYRQANAPAVALDLIVSVLANPATPLATVEKLRFQQINLLYRLYQIYPNGEVQALQPLPGFDPSVSNDPKLYQPTKAESENQYGGWEVWYIRQVIDLGNKLRQDFPESPYNDDVLLTLYEMTQRVSYLEKLIQDYPQGDRVEEAKAARYMLQHP
jgi:hypothetical protein